MGGKGKVWWWIVVALFLLAFLWFVPQLQGRYFSQGVPAEEIPALVNEYRRTWAQILGGAALFSGIYFTWRTLQVNREGQITERFTRAIDQLGATHDDNSKNLELRLGGIYALERISKESEEDHGSIMEVLTAYVRQHAPWQPEDAQQVEEDAAVEKKSEEDLRGKSETTEVPDLAADIQAIITVIRRRTRYFGDGETEALDLHETNLFSANLWHANLWHANLFRANLSGAYLLGADLLGAGPVGANLVGANLYGANLSGAYLGGADLTDAILVGAILTQEQLEETMSGDENTQLPPHLKPPAHWNVKTDEQIEGD